LLPLPGGFSFHFGASSPSPFVAGFAATSQPAYPAFAAGFGIGCLLQICAYPPRFPGRFHLAEIAPPRASARPCPPDCGEVELLQGLNVAKPGFLHGILLSARFRLRRWSVSRAFQGRELIFAQSSLARFVRRSKPLIGGQLFPARGQFIRPVKFSRRGSQVMALPRVQRLQVRHCPSALDSPVPQCFPQIGRA